MLKEELYAFRAEREVANAAVRNERDVTVVEERRLIYGAHYL